MSQLINENCIVFDMEGDKLSLIHISTEMVIETFEGKKVEMVDCPLVEGAVVATIDSVGGMDFEAIKTALAGVGTSRKF